MSLHKRDQEVLKKIQAESNFSGAGGIRKLKKDAINYRVTSAKDLVVIIDHFDKYPLITQKRADFELFKQVIEIMNQGEHTSMEGLQQIVNLKASMNRGLSDELKAAFPDTIPVARPVVV